MRKETEKIERIEYVDKWIANDGTEFKSEIECRKYEETAKCAVCAAVEKIPYQTTYNVGDSDTFPYFGCEDHLTAFKVRDVNDMEAINRWLIENFGCTNSGIFLSPEDVGTIQMFETYDLDRCVYKIGTPEQLLEQFAKGVDSLVSELV